MARLPRRQMLRQGTSRIHAALDDLIGPFSSLGAYEAYLLGTARFRLPLERTIEHHAPMAVLDGWHPTMIGNEIRADLSALDLPNDTEGLAAPHPQQIEDWLGLFYVLEGSSLGAKLLVKRAAALNLDQHSGVAHLIVQAGNFSNWNAFLPILENILDIDSDRMIHWANVTFSFAHQAFENTMDAALAER